jgi:hypothetical protein
VVDGYLTGPLPGDLGDWHATATAGGTRTSAAPTPSPTPSSRTTIPSGQSCGPGLARCGSVCVDLQTDVRNCSVCQLACSSGAACINGSCVCPSDRSTSCNGVCVDLSSDLNNCGACGEICESGLVPVECRSGVCERASCPVGIEYCGAADLCRDLSSDPEHCGACGNACPSGVCSGGVCQSVPIANIPLDEAPPEQTSCPPELVLCGDGMGVCVDVGFDSANCGGCGFTCVGSERCEFGTCVPSVPIANIPLDEAPPNSPCLPGLVYCGNGICVDIFIDSFNCGGCGITCQFPQGCQGGVCVG